MAYTQSYYHIIFRTYRSQRTLEEAHERDLYMYIYSYCRNKKIKLWRINSMPDHIHLFVSLPPNLAVATFVRELKKTSGNFLKTHKKEFPMFEGWSEGYCSITYSIAEKESVINYIANQKEHHHHKSFADEMTEIMKNGGMETNTEYFRKDWME